MREEAIIARLAARIGPTSRLGDDVAWLGEVGDSGLVATVDSQIEGVHYRPASLPPERVARRLVAVNASDLAASGSRPRWGLLALGAPPGYPVDAFLDAAAVALGELGAELVGGDLASGGRLVASLTLLGEPVRRGPLLGRDQARVGDRLFLGGPVGESALGCRLAALGGSWPLELDQPTPPAGLPEQHISAARAALRRHFAPEPQLELGARLGQSRTRIAALDISDGLAKDAARLASASGVGITIDQHAVEPTGELAALAHALGLDPPTLALGGGEDYVLLVAGDDELEVLGLVPIGTVEEEPGLRLRRPDGVVVELDPLGWDHLER